MCICTIIRCSNIVYNETLENLRKRRGEKRILSMMKEIDMSSRAVVNRRERRVLVRTLVQMGMNDSVDNRTFPIRPMLDGRPKEERCGCVLDGAYLNVDVNLGERVTQRMPTRLHRLLGILLLLECHLELVD